MGTAAGHERRLGRRHRVAPTPVAWRFAAEPSEADRAADAELELTSRPAWVFGVGRVVELSVSGAAMLVPADAVVPQLGQTLTLAVDGIEGDVVVRRVQPGPDQTAQRIGLEFRATNSALTDALYRRMPVTPEVEEAPSPLADLPLPAGFVSSSSSPSFSAGPAVDDLDAIERAEAAWLDEATPAPSTGAEPDPSVAPTGTAGEPDGAPSDGPGGDEASGGDAPAERPKRTSWLSRRSKKADDDAADPATADGAPSEDAKAAKKSRKKLAKVSARTACFQLAEAIHGTNLVAHQVLRSGRPDPEARIELLERANEVKELAHQLSRTGRSQFVAVGLDAAVQSSELVRLALRVAGGTPVGADEREQAARAAGDSLDAVLPALQV